MDEGEARAIANAQARELRARRYEELRGGLLGNPETIEVVASSGVTYQVERQAVIEGPGENLRVTVSVDDGGVSILAPVTIDFIVSPQDTFIGE